MSVMFKEGVWSEIEFLVLPMTYPVILGGTWLSQNQVTIDYGQSKVYWKQENDVIEVKRYFPSSGQARAEQVSAKQFAKLAKHADVSMYVSFAVQQPSPAQ